MAWVIYKTRTWHQTSEMWDLSLWSEGGLPFYTVCGGQGIYLSLCLGQEDPTFCVGVSFTHAEGSRHDMCIVGGSLYNIHRGRKPTFPCVVGIKHTHLYLWIAGVPTDLYVEGRGPNFLYGGGGISTIQAWIPTFLCLGEDATFPYVEGSMPTFFFVDDRFTVPRVGINCSMDAGRLS